jgi:hypothetical protein
VESLATQSWTPYPVFGTPSLIMRPHGPLNVFNLWTSEMYLTASPTNICVTFCRGAEVVHVHSLLRPLWKYYGFRTNKLKFERSHIHAVWSTKIVPTKYGHVCPCLYPFLRSLEVTLPRIRIWQGKRHAPVLAYSDDVIVFVTQPAVFTTIPKAVRRYELAIGASLNTHKSKSMAVGTWKESETILGIEFHDRVHILDVTLGPTIAFASTDSWKNVISNVRAEARKFYARNLCLVQRIHYVQMYLLANI